MASIRAAASRLRWRMRGAWLWPSFALLTVADAVLLTLQPISGSDTDVVGAFILVGFANVLAIALLAPALGALWRRRDPSLPTVVARDRAGVVLLLGVSALLVGLGLLHRGGADAQRDAFRAQSDAARAYVAVHAPAEYRRNIDAADTIHPGGTTYRTCVPGDAPHRPLCLWIDVAHRPPSVRRDGDRRTNLEVTGRE
jgi:hypothetical protein